jgi:hypothetical protein
MKPMTYSSKQLKWDIRQRPVMVEATALWEDRITSGLPRSCLKTYQPLRKDD